MTNDPDARMDRLRKAARYRFAQYAEEQARETEASGTPASRSLDPDEVRAERRLRGARDMVAHANALIEEGDERGVFEHNPLRGKPLPDNDGRHDPDWWIRRYVEREELTGLGPPALALRKEDAELDARLDEESSERRVREIVEDFDARVVEARRQLMGGPPVVTPVRDVDVEIERWRDRREARHAVERAAAAEQAAADAEERQRRRRWWRRR
ncbi:MULTISPECIES: DUF1992 domain-containing protein [unclassified Curtobacterium]|uniref:DnaJ family domain-containing protein n=1 Tax=unclassified Curtobacterium TaxID=257496 RepID=UPI000DA8525B|nr:MULTISPECIES: DUF1992 domain-containing protein [unclassified Curtobacterium]PZE28083.1 DUF1992 domain-containing protein [Curtobacterium sp. MCBD17_028]PZE74024.1 DUF1992 domain-containing protein [Curtobacterium sp. MCBD17_019]PZF63820.1 DUF1992 domain-containing protein [Curtobacterium sp. MCBD17_013]